MDIQLLTLKKYLVTVRKVISVEESLEKLKELRDVQVDFVIDGYGLGLYNGIELSIAVIEGKDPVFKDMTDIRNKQQNKPSNL